MPAAVQQRRLLGEMNTLITALVLVGVHLLCRSGVMLLWPLAKLAGWNTGHAMKVIATWLFLANSAVNPTVYIARNPVVVAAFRRHRQCEPRKLDRSRASLAYETSSGAVPVVRDTAWDCYAVSDVTSESTDSVDRPACVFYLSGRNL